MFDSVDRTQIAINYHTVVRLLKYSLSKLDFHRKELEEFVFSSSSITERRKEIMELLLVTEKDFESAYSHCQKSLPDSKFQFAITTIKDDFYPVPLKYIHRPPWVLFSQGFMELLQTPCVSIVGSRVASDEGIKRAQRLAHLLVKSNCTIVSGLAKGIDRAAHTGAIKNGGDTIAVIGTPLNKYYPAENAALQREIAEHHLVVSQFPFGQETSRINFPTRNITMCGLSQATIIVEASETSGALYQAQACIKEGRRLFIMKSILENKDLSWPAKFIEKGAVVLQTPEQFLEELEALYDPLKASPLTEGVHQLNLFG